MKQNLFKPEFCYDKSGYFTPAFIIKYCMEHKISKCCVIGGRGTGKSVGTLGYLLRNQIYFAYSRRYPEQLQVLADPSISLLKAVRRNWDLEFGLTKIAKDMYGVYHTRYDDEKEKDVCFGRDVGISFPISTSHKLKGFDGLDVDVWVYDEILPDKSERPVRDEGTAIKKAYETINRNREFNIIEGTKKDTGRPPLLLLAMGNSDTVSNPVTIQFKWVRPLLEMKRNRVQIHMPDSQTLLILLDDSQISQAKADTAFYSTADDKYKVMAINNDFTDDTFGNCRFIPIKELEPIVALGELCFYRHKGEDFLYCTDHYSGSAKKFEADPIGVNKFMKQNPKIAAAYWLDKLIFRDNMCEGLFRDYIKTR